MVFARMVDVCELCGMPKFLLARCLRVLFRTDSGKRQDASEADKRSSDDKGGYYRGYFAMLLCRVTLGHVQMLQSPDPEAHLCVGPDKDRADARHQA